MNDIQEMASASPRYPQLAEVLLQESAWQGKEAAGDFGERPAVDQKCWHLAGWIDRKERGRSRFLPGEGDRSALERHADFVQCNMHCH
jgi:hypothetical protein